MRRLTLLVTAIGVVSLLPAGWRWPPPSTAPPPPTTSLEPGAQTTGGLGGMITSGSGRRDRVAATGATTRYLGMPVRMR